ncbi:protein kinase domain-containing protein [Colletotrichum lupini]|uniref:Protein kinase domain-containing protein n=1 Tax=Colletotrichum lupini TaxID=145971 RepID=A0A9Q8T3J6_9PEZI|nr:protein kinase domain-containing protein [Colletotrichum lupini]KAK1703148.1 hypothetical protein BDP67DRAFT_481871 [Colletotrichum lupini]UQC87551.1 protein kinase domain-containing protein [Colletotrichum lupini]
MPIMYRASETVLHIQRGYPVDIWSVEFAVYLFAGKTLFSARKVDGSSSDGAHFAKLIAVLGPPPLELLNQHRNRALEYWDAQGSNWRNLVPIPRGKPLEAVGSKLENNLKFLQFIRRALTWDPDTRPTAEQLLQDPWLTD